MLMDYRYEEGDLVEIIQSYWPVDEEEAEKILQKFIHVFGTKGTEKHLNMNASVCAITDISPDNYLELCKEIERIVMTDKDNTYFVVGIRNLLMAKHAP